MANPTALADLEPGEVVLDLGSGGGIDVLLSARRVGPTGKAFGLDMTDEMLAPAEQNKQRSGLRNVEFLRGEIESIPLPDASIDAVISNCVINLSAEKDRVLREAFRVLRPAAGGRDRRLPPMLGKRGGPAGERLTAELSRYKLAKITGCDHDGYHRVACPAVQGKLRCELRPPSMELPHTRPQVLCPPEHPPAVPSRRSPCRRAHTARPPRPGQPPPA